MISRTFDEEIPACAVDCSRMYCDSTQLMLTFLKAELYGLVPPTSGQKYLAELWTMPDLMDYASFGTDFEEIYLNGTSFGNKPKVQALTGLVRGEYGKTTAFDGIYETNWAIRDVGGCSEFNNEPAETTHCFELDMDATDASKIGKCSFLIEAIGNGLPHYKISKGECVNPDEANRYPYLFMPWDLPLMKYQGSISTLNYGTYYTGARNDKLIFRSLLAQDFPDFLTTNQYLFADELAESNNTELTGVDTAEDGNALGYIRLDLTKSRVSLQDLNTTTTVILRNNYEDGLNDFFNIIRHSNTAEVPATSGSSASNNGDFLLSQVITFISDLGFNIAKK
ncbi:MAG: hypothetical protein GOV15_02395 [Candidatus Diapherotrites archaeon]|nr:hypothetical protein [Candidatus Diapherotrites archaeon]